MRHSNESREAAAGVAPASLPIDRLLPEIIELLRGGRSLVVEAPPGAGKTTRVPPALAGLDSGDVLVLEPRRLAARLAARFIARERGAPIANDSGKSEGGCEVRGGRATVRSILFLVAEIVRRYDPDFAAFHRKLTQAGKAKKAVRVALARKLLVRLNAKARDARKELAFAA